MRNLLLKISITLLVLVIGFSCEYFKLMSYNEWKQFIESAGSDDLAPVFRKIQYLWRVNQHYLIQHRMEQ